MEWRGAVWLQNNSSLNIENQMDLLKAVPIHCPYCGEVIELLVDCSVPRQEYVEDCDVCCKPIAVSVYATESDFPRVEARQEGE